MTATDRPTPPAPPVPSRRLEALEVAVAAELVRLAERGVAPGLHLVATPIGTLGDVTLRALVTLAEADRVLCEDTRVSRTLLAHYGIGRRLDAYHDHSTDADRHRILDWLADGRSVALIADAGTPLVSDPGLRLVRAVIAAGHAVHAVPGASALLAGLTVSGLASDSVLFAGFLPAKNAARRGRLAELAVVPATLILFEAPGRVAATLAAMAEVLGPDRDAVVARELTKRFEEVRRGPLAQLAQAVASGDELRGEVVIVVGPPPAVAVDDAEIRQRLVVALAGQSVRDAARDVALALGVPRARVYQLALELRRDR